MMPESPIANSIDLDLVRRNTERIARSVGVPVIAVVKSDAYGLGARRVAEAIADLVAGFCVFSLAEANAAKLREVTKNPTLCLYSGPDQTAEDFLAARAQPAVWNVEQATRLKSARPVLAVDLGMQRFACPLPDVERVLAAGECDEAFTHATTVEQARQLYDLLGNRGIRLHAAGSSLLQEPAARLDAVRPGMALFRGTARVSARLIETRDSNRPAGYTGFVTPRFGIILCGYGRGLWAGPCVVNGQRRRILEVGMQTAYVEIGPNDRAGDEVVLLGDGLTEKEIAAAWRTSEHEALVRLARLG